MPKDSSKTVIVTGGAGYIGRITAELLHRDGFSPVLVDNLSRSPRPAGCPFPLHEVDLSDYAATQRAWETIGPTFAVIHFAAFALVNESTKMPEEYFRNNLLSTLHTAQASIAVGTGAYVHSSSCAVYGKPTQVPIPETHPMNPISPYGETKFLGERILRQLKTYRQLRALNLRYFNPAGALDEGRLGEAHEPETHLIPNVVRGFLNNTPIPVYGDKYPTADGTCVRDFIHVEDLAEAHIAAIRFLHDPAGPPTEAINIGAGTGSSVKEVIETAERVFQKKAQIQWNPAREGDPPALVADTRLCTQRLKWKPKRTLEAMIRSHAQWERTRKP